MISYRLPFIEVSIRKALEFFEIPYSENERFSCCPEPNGIKNSNDLIYSITASRNLALAEKDQKHILTPCNGCFETLKAIRSEVKSDLHFQKEMNAHLQKINLNVSGQYDVYHLVEFFHNLGKDTIKDNIVYPLNGLRVAVHYGCHFLRPSNKIQMDDPMEPHIFDELIEDLGAKSVEYDRKMDCCGGSLDRADNPDSGLEMVHNKLENMKQRRVDCIVVGCPQCFMQFDHLQQDLKKLDYEYDIPVLYYSELLCIALGIDIKEIIQKYHRTPVEKVYTKVNDIHQKNKEIQKNFDVEFLKTCKDCGACNNDCPVAKITTFDPNQIIRRILEGDIENVLQDPQIWMCLDCYVCYELCPSRVGLVEIFTTLRNLARKKGYMAEGFKNEYASFQKTGTVAMFSKSARRRVGLESTKPKLNDLKKLLSELKGEMESEI
ncbi:MAG: 4Fe-4S dicluster domain-containing protein [Promethearchaeota archaeon]|nr:MAG: 4Fe-4S dicluster domain-containing protein [Candidatus Lokiarchaeota archaeon]